MPSASPSQIIAEISKELEILRTQSLSYPDKAAEILQDGLVRIQVSLEDLTTLLGGMIEEARDVFVNDKQAREYERHLLCHEKLLYATQKVLAYKDLEALLQMAAEVSRDITGAKYTATGYGHVNGIFTTGGASHSEEVMPCPPGEMLNAEKGGAYLSLIQGKNSIRFTDAEMHAHSAWCILPKDHVPLRGLLGARLVDAKGQPNGLIAVSDKETGGDFTVEDETILSQLAAIVSLALQHIEARLEADNAKRRLEALMKALPIGVCFSDDTSCESIIGNPAALAQFEAGPEDNISASAPFDSAPGRQVHYFLDGQQIGDTELPLQRAVAENRKIPPMELEVKLPSGRRWFAEASGAPIHDEQGNVIGGVAVTVDITECKRTEAELDNYRKHLEDLVEDRTRELRAANAQLQAEIDERKKAEEALKEVRSNLERSLRFTEALLSAIPTPAFFKDREGRYIGCNHAFSELMGVAADQIRGKTVEELWSADYSAVYRQKDLELMEHPRVQVYDFKVQDKDGVVRPVIYVKNVFYDEHNKIAGIVGTFVDITERKKAEKALQDSHEDIIALMNSTQDIVLIINPQGVILEINDLAAKALREDPCNLIGQKAQELLPISAGTARMNHLSKALLSRQSYNFKDENNGRFFSHTLYPVLNSSGEVARIIIVAREITERKKMEEELRKARDELEKRIQERTAELLKANLALTESEERFRIALKNSPSLVFNQDKDLRYTWVYHPHPGLEEYTIIGKRDEELFSPEDAAQLTRIKRRVLQSGFGERAEVRITINGEILFYDLTVEPLRNAAGEIKGVTCSSTDITYHKKAEEELRRSKEAAEEATRIKEAFMANMSHELRTPMNYIMGMTSLLLDEPLTPELKDYVETIRKGSDEMMALINNILDFTRAEKDKVVLEYHTLSLRKLVEESLETVVSQAAKKSLNLVSTIKHGTPDSIVGDHYRLLQILASLLSNAVKFTDVGEISVSVSSEPLEGKRHQILFAIKDTGIGIPSEKMSELFQPFAQVETNISRKRDGVGINLATNKKLVELMGGEIWARSEVVKGSTFYFTIAAEIAQNDSVKPE